MDKIPTKKKSGAVAKANINVRIVGDGLFKNTQDATSQIIDPFEMFYRSGDGILQPEFNLEVLAKMPLLSDTLGQCIAAYETNCDGFGQQFVKAEYLKDEKEDPPELVKERRRLTMLFDYCNTDESFIQVRKRLRRDRESTGDAYMEVLRNRKGEPAEFYRMPAWSVRKTIKDTEITKVIQMIRNEEGVFEPMPRLKRFRRYVQFFGYGEKIYFKEYSDPRPISRLDGTVNEADPQATEVINFTNPTSYGQYGMPRWIGCLMAIMGSRKAEEVNLSFFDNKAIPPMVILVSGGMLAEGMEEKIRRVFQKEIKGSDNFHDIIILEAEPFEGGEIGGEKLAPVKIELQPLTKHIDKDATHREYRQDNSMSVRSSMRLPPIYVGLAQEYTRATALESIKVTENQVFMPEREEFDSVINRKILPDLDINTLTFKSEGVKVSDDASIIRALGTVKEALPIGMVQDAAADMLGQKRIEMDEELYQIPIALIGSARKLILGDAVGEEDVVPDGDQDDDTDSDDEKKQKQTEKAHEFIAQLFYMRDLISKMQKSGSTELVLKPMPKPKKNETKAAFLDRFMANETMVTEYSDNKQRYAVANRVWRTSKKPKKKK
jgi:PBSX family phage portal protein